MPACAICEASDTDAIEALGARALAGEVSWREAARRAGLKYHQPLQNHMQKHYTAPVEAAVQEAESEYEQLIIDTILELQQQMRVAPPEVKPLYAVAIQNLAGLRETKPSQQHLIASLKAIQELTGMRQEQRLMLQFAQHFFTELPERREAPAIEAAEADVIDVLALDESALPASRRDPDEPLPDPEAAATVSDSEAA